MRTYLDCVPCFVRQSLEAARNVTADAALQERMLRDVLGMAATMDFDRPPPFMGQAIHRRLRQLSECADPYEGAKRHFNRLASDALPELGEIVRGSTDPLRAAIACVVAANAIDMAVIGALDDGAVRNALREAPGETLHGNLEEFREVVAGARDILYLADNAGEVVVDRLLIEQLGPHRVTLVVRGSPVLNDATLGDARDCGLTGMVEVIDNGSDAPGTILEDCSESFRRRFDAADLVVAKGLGNFETLFGIQRKIAFLFKVKCPLVSRHVGLPVGSYVALCYRGNGCPGELGDRLPEGSGRADPA